MKSLSLVLGPFFISALCLITAPVHAQTSEASPKSSVPLRYDITKEITLSGIVSSVVKDPAPETNMLGGFHLIIESTSGTVDAHLGAFALEGKAALSVTPGQRIQVTGVMKTIRNQQVFVTRLVLASGHVYVIRNEHGFLVMPTSHTRATTPQAKGGQL